jgi:hypothetical protein
MDQFLGVRPLFLREKERAAEGVRKNVDKSYQQMLVRVNKK